MRNLFKSFFSASKSTIVDPESTEPKAVETPYVIPVSENPNNEVRRDLFIDESNTAFESGACRTEADNPLDEVLKKDHQAAGYRDGYDFQDPDLQKNYHETTIECFREICKNEIRRIDRDMLRINGFLSRREELSASIIKMLEEQANATEYQKVQVLDELTASEEGRGKIRKALLEYDRGFSEGFRDYLEASKLRNPLFQ